MKQAPAEGRGRPVCLPEPGRTHRCAPTEKFGLTLTFVLAGITGLGPKQSFLKTVKEHRILLA
jgi:hypothetical protein